MLNFDSLHQDQGIVSPPHFVYNFSTKMLLVLYSINWPNFIAWLPLLLQILGNRCVAIVFFPHCDLMDFEINLIFLIELLFLYNQKAMKKSYWEWKELLRPNKHFWSFLKSFHWSKIVPDLKLRCNLLMTLL